ncbi:hypothetical protein Poli38472_000925 [Pythium oligandrum]|uniref:SET domain-containing protein n=1 Tax=Pythium oligandrum TaxID=41045 RepID=A0A8K1FJM3_PYTOL|nr:hypothetical protein Poli38472_000925 [Pythium oligandrum]|eukprot:TMW60883.1 hypothetical protein Poli38472_000925 [Pythium oligandrum]
MSATVQAAFGLFDDDSSDDETQQQQEVVPPVVKLVEHLQVTPPPPPTAQNPRPVSASTVLYPSWEDARPEFVGPIQLVDNCEHIGGSRGYVAAEDLEPGTLILVEKVYVPWPKAIDQTDPTFFIATMENILKRDDYKTIVIHLGHLHPQRLSDLPTDLLEAGREKYGSQLEQLRARFPNLDVTHEQMLQNVFGMQCNAFDSGVFLFNAIFNHDCNPNCVKFTPEESDPGVSEVRVAKQIKKGEPLTISYLYPREQSRNRRQRNLREQFGFVCTCELCRRGDSVLPRPPLPPDADTSSGELVVDIEEVEKVVASAEDLLKVGSHGAQVLSIALEALSDALEIVAHDHVVLIRIHKLVADCCDAILRAQPGQDVREYAILFLRSSYELLELQKMYLNNEHIDLARTLNDVSQGIQLLLSLDPKVLLEEFSEWKDFRQASFVENQYRQDYRRIKKLYE